MISIGKQGIVFVALIVIGLFLQTGPACFWQVWLCMTLSAYTELSKFFHITQLLCSFHWLLVALKHWCPPTALKALIKPHPASFSVHASSMARKRMTCIKTSSCTVTAYVQMQIFFFFFGVYAVRIAANRVFSSMPCLGPELLHLFEHM